MSRIDIEIDYAKFSESFSKELAQQLTVAENAVKRLATEAKYGVEYQAPRWSGKTQSSWFIVPGMTPRTLPTTTKRDVYSPEPTPSWKSLPETPLDWNYTLLTTNDYASSVNAGEFKPEHAGFVERGIADAVARVEKIYTSRVAAIAVGEPNKTIWGRIKGWFRGWLGKK